MDGFMGSWKTRDVVLQVELAPHMSSVIPELAEEDWRVVIINYLKEGKLLDDPREARRLKLKSSRYVFVGKRYQEADYVLREVHEGCCGNHMGAHALARKVLLGGYCWPNILGSSQELVTSCDSCQRHDQLQHRSAELMKSIVSSCPFDQWGMDIVGHFLVDPAQKKFLLVEVDYFSKWVEAEPLARITE
ncbi:uncharacterized protein [Henckelia pumila]|uniref:uncharacterized protein n=1 Tax=Henckelia pumila TaxID=405737 RepID=UPI003C6E2FA5